MRLRSIAALLAAALVVSACGQTKTIDGVKYDTHGPLSGPDAHNDKVVVGNVILSVIFVETIIIPLYCLGFDLWEPVCKKPAEPGAAC